MIIFDADNESPLPVINVEEFAIMGDDVLVEQTVALLGIGDYLSLGVGVIVAAALLAFQAFAVVYPSEGIVHASEVAKTIAALSVVGLDAAEVAAAYDETVVDSHAAIAEAFLFLGREEQVFGGVVLLGDVEVYTAVLCLGLDDDEGAWVGE